MTSINSQRIALGDLKSSQDVARLTKHLQDLYNGQINVVTGSGAPSNVPQKIAQQYIDTTNNNVYVATGNTKVSHWVKVS